MEFDDWDSPAPTQVQPSQQYEAPSFSRGRNSRGRNTDNRRGGASSSFGQRNDRSVNGGSGSRIWRGDEVSSNRYSNNRQEESCTITVPSQMVGKVIGRGGATIRSLESESGAKVKISKDTTAYDTEITLIGSKEAQEIATKRIKELTHIPSVFDPEPVKEEKPIEFIDWDKLIANSQIEQEKKWAKCPPIKKDFYFEDPEIAKWDPASVEKFRKEKNNITVKYVFEEAPIPNPVRTFEQAFKNYPEILDEIEKLGFKEPSPIQCQAWPVLLSGQDLIGIAQTGTGKTLAFLLPALIHIDGQPVPREERGGPNVLIIAPTRELAQQIEGEVRKYSYRGIKSVCVYGGGDRRNQINAVSAGVEIVIATPGRLNDLIADGIVEVASVTYLVLDEADRMLDMGFEPQIRKVLLDIHPNRQSVMTSATWPPGVRELASRYMKNPVQVFVGSLDLAAVHSVTQTIVLVDPLEKRDYLKDFLQTLTPEDKVIVFVARKAMADHISSDLAFCGLNVQSIHGDRAQEDREQALQDLKSGEVRILIATDVASRGIDIEDVTKVFNHDFPSNIEEYVHRVGRTGRAGKTGEAITLFTRENWGYAAELIDILTEANQLVPEELYEMAKRFSDMKARREAERAEGGGGGGYQGRRGGGGGRNRDDGDGWGSGGGGRGRGGRRGGRW